MVFQNHVEEEERIPSITKICVICHNSFDLSKHDNISRVVCNDENCLKIYKNHCAVGNNFWSRSFKKKRADEPKTDFTSNEVYVLNMDQPDDWHWERKFPDKKKAKK